MAAPLLATKFFQPGLPPRFVRRPQLVERLRQGWEGDAQLTLISAPAGFGKTICVREALAEAALPSAWLALEPADDDPVRFYSYLFGTLARLNEILGADIRAALQAGQIPPIDTILAVLSNDLLGWGQRCLLVLEDFHVLQEKAILDFIARWIAQPPVGLHVVLVTREDPSLPLARLRASGKLVEIRAEDLRFTREETGQFLNGTLDLGLTAEAIEELDERTEGWAAGLQLAGLSLRGRPDSDEVIAGLNGSHRYILGYLTEEVLAGQPPSVEEFLLKTSILDALNGSLCDALTGRTDGAEMLERLYAANLFLIPLDDERRWYRYHHLFSSLLRTRQQQISQQGLAELHRRAADWYEQAGMISEAVNQALAGADFLRVVRLLEQHAFELVMRGYARTVEGWMAAIPGEWQSKSPRSNLAFAWMHLLRGNYPQVGHFLQRAEESIERMSINDAQRQAYQAEWWTLRANLLQLQGKGTESADLAQNALGVVDKDNRFIRGSAYLALGGAYRNLRDFPRAIEAYQQAIRENRVGGYIAPEMLSVTALMLMTTHHGRLRLAEEVGSSAIHRMEVQKAVPPPIAGGIYGALGFIQYEWNQLDKAKELFLKGEQLSSFSGHNATLVHIRCGLALLLALEGRWAEAHQTAEAAAQMARLGLPAWLRSDVTYRLVQLALRLDPSRAWDLLNSAGLADTFTEADTDARDGEPFLSLAMARLAWAQDEQERAIFLVEKALQQAQVQERLAARITGSLLHAGWVGGVESLGRLEAALEGASGEGYLRTYLDEGELGFAALRCLERSARARQLLAAFPGRAGRPAGNTGHNLAENLTEREIEVLGLIAQGLKYEQVATRLVISVNTVRYYVKEIYSKLGVANRTAAIETARKAGLL